jgi:hypothetical protein
MTRFMLIGNSKELILLGRLPSERGIVRVAVRNAKRKLIEGPDHVMRGQ